MARRSKTFEEAAAEVEERFGHRGIKLVEFEGTAKPSVINCPKHGNQTCSRYANMFIGSSWGCPSCGNEQAAKAGIATLRKNHAGLEMLKQAVTGMTKQERITTQAYNEMSKSVEGSNNIILNDVQGDTTINNHHTHTHHYSDTDGQALSMRQTHGQFRLVCFGGRSFAVYVCRCHARHVHVAGYRKRGFGSGRAAYAPSRRGHRAD